MDVTVVIPVYGKPKYLAACLRSIAEQEFDGRIDVKLMVDLPDYKGEAKANHINDYSVLGNIKDEYFLPKELEVDTVYILAPGRNIGRARKMGVEQATGDIIAFIDSDCVLPDKNWMTRMAAPFLDDHHHYTVTWTLGNFHEDDPIIMRYAILQNTYGPGMIPGTGHTLIRRDSILKVGNIREIPACEDHDIMNRLPGPFLFMSDCRVYHYHATTLRQLLKKQWMYSGICEKYGVKGNSYRTQSMLKYKMHNFFVALFQNDQDSAWLLFPIVDPLLLLVSTIRRLTR